MAERAPFLIADQLTRSYGATVALDHVDLAAVEGSVLAVLGPNGCGKTTTVRIFATLLRADSGHALVGGHDVVTGAAAVRAMIGLADQYAAVDPFLTGRENLELVAELRHLPPYALHAGPYPPGFEPALCLRSFSHWFALATPSDLARQARAVR
jgi:ABC-2 type transport system ATP-binding protein